MKALLVLLLCFFANPMIAQFAYPPAFKDVHVETYRTVGETEMRLWIFGETDPAARKPAIVFFFGGGWNSGSPVQFEPQARHFAARGMIAITADYRVRSRHGAKMADCVEDAKAAIAWVRQHAERLGIDPNKIAASGGSAGGHLFNPACALAPIAGWQASGAGADLDRERLGAEPEALSPAHHVGPHTPPTLIVHGKEDTTVPYASAVAFAQVMKDADRPCKLVGYEGANHGFFNRGEGYRQTLAEADAFLVGLGWIHQ
jgi:acetyl esterase/lipase